MIIAGKTNGFSRAPEDWIFLDIGFSSEAKTCGLKIFGKPAQNQSWANSCLEIKNAIHARYKNVNLMIEAPLSVTFNSKNNPVRRSFEKRGKSTRYWYLQGGAVTLLSAAYLISELYELKDHRISLYEAFISFKPEKTDHLDDASLMERGIVEGVMPVDETSMLISNKHKIESSMTRFGYNFGVPPVFIFDPPTSL